ncbi:hypothetical protein D3C78_1217740 [compost metagenome]
MALSISIGKAVAEEAYFSASVIARQAFNVTVSGGSGTVTIYANSTTNDKAFNLGTISGGAGTKSVTITSVYGTSSNRKITVVDGANNSASIIVGVWFKGDISTFSVSGGTPACGASGIPSNFAALPATGLCGEDLVIANPGTGQSATAVVWDVGPWVPYRNCSADPYWNTGTVPFAQQHKDEKRCGLCSCPAGATDYKINGAILDVSSSVLSSVGASGTLTNGVWRFT